MPLYWAVHRLGGLVTPANAAYSADEMVHQLKDSKAKAFFTCAPLLPAALEAAAKAGLPKSRIYLLEVPQVILGGANPPTGYKTVSDFVQAGKSLPALEELRFGPGEGARRTAFLCYSSGTSGLPACFKPGHPFCHWRAHPTDEWSLERSDDFAPQCHRQFHANQGF